MKHRGQDGQVM